MVQSDGRVDVRALEKLARREGGSSPRDLKLPPFATNLWALSMWLTSEWAEQQNAEYVFIETTTTKQTCANPVDATRPPLHVFWCKCTALLVALHLARNSALDFVLFVDTDMIPGDPRASLAKTVEGAFDASPQLQAMFGTDDEWWWTLLQWSLTYSGGKGALNAGLIALRVSDEGEQLLRKVFFELTQRPSPFERMFNRTVVRVARGGGGGAGATERKPLTHAEITDLLAFSMRDLPSPFGSNLRVQTLGRQNTGKEAAFELMPPAASSEEQLDDFHSRVVPLCCSSGPDSICARAFDAPKVSCTPSKQFDALTGWPGDQDRWAWAAFVSQKGTCRISGELAKTCTYPLPSRPVPDAFWEGVMMEHHCHPAHKSKWSVARALGRVMRSREWNESRRARGPVPGNDDDDDVDAFGWTSLARRACLLTFPPGVADLPALDVVREVVDFGRGLLSPPRVDGDGSAPR